LNNKVAGAKAPATFAFLFQGVFIYADFGRLRQSLRLG
jgi:hypothetical protein